MGEDQVALERRRVGSRDLDAGELAEAGVYAVDGFLAHGGRGDPLGRALDGRLRGTVDARGQALAVDAFELGQRDAARRKGHDAHCAPPKMRSCSGLKPMR